MVEILNGDQHAGQINNTTDLLYGQSGAVSYRYGSNVKTIKEMDEYIPTVNSQGMVVAANGSVIKGIDGQNLSLSSLNDLLKEVSENPYSRAADDLKKLADDMKRQGALVRDRDGFLPDEAINPFATKDSLPSKSAYEISNAQPIETPSTNSSPINREPEHPQVSEPNSQSGKQAETPAVHEPVAREVVVTQPAPATPA